MFYKEQTHEAILKQKRHGTAKGRRKHEHEGKTDSVLL